MTNKARTKNCLRCGAEFVERYGASEVQWAERKYCGWLCLNRAKDHTPPPLAKRFWERVDKRGSDECWPWKGPVNARGRARMHLDRALRAQFGVRHISASRVLWFLTHGAWPAKGIVIRHTCDNPGCLNPSHTLDGTQADNIADMVARGRRGDMVAAAYKGHITRRLRVKRQREQANA